jgi:hypothetical protein
LAPDPFLVLVSVLERKKAPVSVLTREALVSNNPICLNGMIFDATKLQFCGEEETGVQGQVIQNRGI